MTAMVSLRMSVVVDVVAAMMMPLSDTGVYFDEAMIFFKKCTVSHARQLDSARSRL